MNEKFVTDHDVYSHLSNSYGRNHFVIDKPMTKLVEFFAEKAPELAKLGEFVGKEMYEITDYIDKRTSPKIVTWGINGERVDLAWLDPSERLILSKLLKEFGVNKSPYHDGSWFEHYLSLYLVADPGIACIVTLTNQTAYALYKYGNDSQKKVISFLLGENSDELAFGATWFSEIQGGSDLGANVVSAYQDARKNWKISGETKYFASNAGLANYSLVTARPIGAPNGAKGLALFLVPRRDSKSRNNYKITRLKEKSATRAVPTGEVEFHNSEAELIGDAAKGIYYVMENLTVSRIANSFGALGLARKSYLEAYYYAQKRYSFGKPLIEHPLVVRDLLGMEVWIEGTLALALKTVSEFQKCWREPLPASKTYNYTRLLTHISKNLASDMSASVTRMSMELHGGLGFLSEFPIERLHREALVTPIWEGGSNIQALDMFEVIGKGAGATLVEDMGALSSNINHEKELADYCLRNIESTLLKFDSIKENEQEVQFIAKDILNLLGHNIATILLLSAGRSPNAFRFTFAGRQYYSRFLAKEAPGNVSILEARKYVSIDQQDE